LMRSRLMGTFFIVTSNDKRNSSRPGSITDYTPESILSVFSPISISRSVLRSLEAHVPKVNK